MHNFDTSRIRGQRRERRMAHKKRTPAQALSLLLSKGEIWEVGRRVLDVPVADLPRKGERPEVLLVVQAGEDGGVVFGDATTSSAPPAVLVDMVVRAMREPLLGKPRRPEVIRVGSPAEAELLATAPAMAGVALEVARQLDALAHFHAHMELQLSGLSSDYRTQAARAGETLSPEGLQAFFRTARQFYREAMWEAYGDEVVFELALQTASGASKTLYGIIIGELGQELGLALYPSLEALQQFYNASLEHLDQLSDLEQPVTQQPGPAQWQREAEAMADLLQVSTLCLTYTPQRDVPPPLVEEVKQCKLPVANKSAFPLVMRTGQGGMRAATALELADMCVAMGAIMDWDKRIDTVTSEGEMDITLTLQVPAVPGFLPMLTVHTTLRDNPCLPEEDDEDDEDGWLPDLTALLESFLQEAPRSKPASQKKPREQAASGRKSPAPDQTTPPPATPANKGRGKGKYPHIAQ